VTLTSSGCAPLVIGYAATASERATVRITEDASTVQGCTFVRPVRTYSLWGGVFLQERALEKTIAEASHITEAAGANVLLIRTKSMTMSSSSTDGDAYLCPSDPTRLPNIPENR
jgi:hypothetical protein